MTGAGSSRHARIAFRDGDDVLAASPRASATAAIGDLSRLNWDRQELLSLLSASATLAGLCITVVALMNAFNKANSGATIVDDVLALCAAAFLLSTYLIFWALRSSSPSVAVVLTKSVDVIFLAALSAMTAAGFIMLYTIW
ncbi:MAG TPA: hypothetical protein VGK20_17675 [Candidatus Binatia bacterium]|jgi:hypothetical protein